MSYEDSRSFDGDEELKGLLAQDIKRYFELFVLSYYKKVYAFIHSCYTKEYAEDLTQETFVQAYRAMDGYSPERIQALRLRPWLFTIAKNLSLNHCTRYIKGSTVSTAYIQEEELLQMTQQSQCLSLEEMVEQKETYETLCSYILKLPDNLREACALHYIFDLEYHEISEILQKPLNTVKSWGRRGRVMLSTLIREEME